MPALHINGTVTPTNSNCISLDKLVVKFYDPDSGNPEPFASANVDVTGSFVKDIGWPIAMNLVAKLLVVNRDNTETEVTSQEFFNIHTPLAIEFEYNEDNFSYAHDIALSVTGQVTAVDVNCISYDKLVTKFYDGYDEAAGPFDSAACDASGYFSKDITLPSINLVAKLFVVNRDNSETLVESKQYYYETEALEIDFSYNENNYSYAHPVISINGLVTPAENPCTSLDKLLVKFYDGYDETTGTFDSVAVNSAGVFLKDIDAPSRSVISKLYVENADGTETLVETDTQYCNANDLDISFNYDESQFSYSNNNNNNNMALQVNGVVISATEEYFSCTDTTNLKVRFYQVTFGSLTLIGDFTAVNRDGTFSKSLTTPPNAFLAKLFLVDNGNEVFVAESEKFCHHDKVDLIFSIEESKIGRPVLAKVKERLVAAGLTNLSNITSLTDDQISELSCLSCLSVGAIKRLKEAYELWNQLNDYSIESPYADAQSKLNLFRGVDMKDTSITIFFALLRFLSTSLHEAFSFSRTQFSNNITTCIELNEVATGLVTTDNLNLLEGARNALLLNAEDDGEFFDAKIVNLTTLDYTGKNELLNKIITEGGFDKSLPTNPADYTDQDREILALKTLGVHLKNYAPFLKTVANAMDPAVDYYQLTLDGAGTWTTLITSVPSGYTNAAEYANAIDQSIAQQEPSARVARGLSAAGIPDAANIYAKLTTTTNRAFNIREQSTNDFFVVKTDPDVTKPHEVTREMLNKIQSLQRSVKLVGNEDDLVTSKKLIQTNMHSSYAISKTGKVGFMKLMADNSVSLDKAEGIYNRARGIFETLTMLAVQHKQYDSPNAWLPEAGQGHGSYFPGGSVSQNLPDLEGMFGSLNTCECSTCQSVYSPAAYLTDMLNWLNKDIPASFLYTAPNPVAYYSLMQAYNATDTTVYNRRGDIAKILLCCDNTNTMMPYIDLVNELLTWPLTQFIPAPGAPYMTDMSELQTRKTTEEILVEPENRKRDAEVVLNTIYYPWTLPYDSSYSESIVYLNELNKPYDELIHDFSKDTDQYNNAGWANAYLKINAKEATMLGASTTGTNFWRDYWGLPIGTTAPKVSPIMKVAGLDLDDLKELLTASFIESSGVIAIEADTTDLCDFDKYSFDPALNSTRADKFMRFLRLKRKTQLTTLELDIAIKNLSSSSVINSAFITKLASALAFCEKYGLKFLDHQVWFSNIVYTQIWNSNASDYYTNKFRNPLLSDKIRSFFDPTQTTGNYVFAATTLTTENKQMLSSVLNISIPAINYLLSYLSISAPLDKTKLAKLDRYAGLINVFKLDVKEIANIFKLIGDPLNTTTYPDTLKAVWNFETILSKLRDFASNPNDLNDIIEGTGYFALASNIATNADFDLEAKACWEKVEFAFQEARRANPEKTFSDTTYMPSAPNITFYSEVVLRNFLLSFNINYTDASALLTKYDSDLSITWLSTYIKDPDAKQGTSFKREWAANLNMRTTFTPLYKFFKRIQLLSDLCELDLSGVSYGVSNATTTGSTYVLPGTPFSWMRIGYTYTSGDISKFFWLKDSTEQAALLNLYKSATPTKTPQQLYFEECSLYYNLCPPGAGYTTTQISNLYNALGEDSKCKTLSEQEVTELFVSAESKTTGTTTKDFTGIIIKLYKFISASQDLNIKFIDAWNWIWTNPTGTTPAQLSSYSEDIRRVLNTHYPNFKSWSEFIVPIQNQFRIQLRDALVAYHIGEFGYEDDKDLYSFYLLDTQMSPCMMTSRVVAATSSVQLLIHRALLGLESEIEMSSDNKKEWQWRKNYRVWEANRKVFLYPENWIDPTLRLNKTFLFKEAEELLLQDDINAKNTETAYAGYLLGLNEMARLDVRAVYNEYPPYDNVDRQPGDGWAGWNGYQEAPQQKMHVFARTWNTPYVYYHRVLYKGIWSAWEKIDVELDSDHLIPTMFNRKLYLFFPIFIEKTYDGDEKRKYYEIKMCYIKYDFGKWSNKKIMDEKLLAGAVSYHNVENKEENLYLLTPTYNEVYYNPGVPAGGGYREKLYFVGQSASGDLTYRNYGNGNNNLYWLEKPGIATDGGNQLHFAFVSMKKKDFFFWAEIKSDGDLIIHVRRAAVLDPHLLRWQIWDSMEYAYESSFRVSACNERLKVILPVIVTTQHGNEPYIVERPWAAMPYYQQMIEDEKMFPNTSYSGVMLRNPGRTVGPLSSDYIFSGDAYKFILTYPDQYKNAYKGTPFFYSDQRHNFFFKSKPEPGTTYDLILNEHPFVCKMLTALNRFGIEGLLNSGDADLKRQTEVISEGDPDYLPSYQYTWRINNLPDLKYDFDAQGTYSIYNWEVFFHAVTLIGRQLRQSNKFADAFKWLGYIFDPNNRDTGLAIPQSRFWKIQPFLIDVSNGSIQKMMRTLSAGPSSPYYNPTERANIVSQINAWRTNPFDPHLIASMRPRAYMLWTVMEFIENIIDWADSLFRQDSMESINEALNLYILASQLLGKRPVKVSRPDPDCKSFSQIIDEVDPFSNLFVEFENHTVSVGGPSWVKGGAEGTAYDVGNFDVSPSSGSSITLGDGSYGGTTANVSVVDLYFCIPDNPKLTGLWDRVDDRLFKIRHCMNIDGKVRDLALFSAPIDPALLVKAVAAGLSVEDALSDLATPMPHYRFSYLLQKANEFNSEVKALGSQLLGLLEKQDSEELSIFRQVHEQNILKSARALKQMAIDEAKQNLATLQASKTLIQIRLDDYTNRQFTNSRELAAQSFTKKSEDLGIKEQGVRLIAGLMNLIPEIYVGTTPTKYFGGSKLSALVGSGANVIGIYSTINRNKASMSLTFAGYDRRQEDWNLQKKTAAEELRQVDRQILSSEIRIAVTEKELANHDLQVAQSEEMYAWLKDKYTNGKLYSWMSGQLKSVYKQVFNLAYDMGKRAQVAMDYELGSSGSSIIQYGQWDSSKSGLLAGERLGLQLKQLEAQYIKNNARELELSKNISLALHDPKALQDLIVKGKCTFNLPEYLFDLDHPGQFFRRIKSVSISIPCIAGPNTNINAILSLSQTGIRKDPTVGTYAPTSIDPIPLESIATSSAQNDGGVFELNFKDERYLPFEGKGAVSEWTLELSQITRSGKDAIRLFDFETISDVVVHMKYTARYDGGLATSVKTYIDTNLPNQVSGAFGDNVLHVFSLRHDMPNVWANFVKTGNSNFKIEKARLPYMIQLLTPKVKEIQAVVIPKGAYTGTKNLTLSCAASGATFSSTSFPDYANSPMLVKPMICTQTYTVAVNTDLDINIAAVIPASTNIEDILIIAKVTLI